MKIGPFPTLVATAALLPVLGGVGLAAQDRYTLKVPGGLSFSEFRGYEDWRDVAVSATKTGIKLIAANDVMLRAYRAGLPADGKVFPEGSKVVKIEWTQKQNAVSPYFVIVPNTLKSVSFIEKDFSGSPRPMAGPTPSSSMIRRQVP